MFYLPTTKDAMNAAIGHAIHDILAAKLAKQVADFDPTTPYSWDQKKSMPEPEFDMATYCASIRAGQGSKRGLRN